MPSLPSTTTILLSLFVLFTVQTAVSAIMRYSWFVPLVFTTSSTALEDALSAATLQGGKCQGANTSIDLSWHAPAKTDINNLSKVINGTGAYGFIFDSSQGPPNKYNWCNMPHTNPTTYPRPSRDYKLEYVEVIHRHHKRTPYASNTFPRENYPWDCSDEGLFYGGRPINPSGNSSSNTYWSVYTSSSNPFAPQGFNGTCQFPQITRGGLDDSHQHGVDLKAVYHDLLDFIPSRYDPDIVSYRVTNNVITSQVASMLIAGMYPDRADKSTPLLIQPNSIDSLEPKFSCPSASALFSSYGSGSSAPAWRQHLDLSADLYARLDSLSGVSPSDSGWHASFDHYFDNLSARLCHAKPLPCRLTNSSDCVTRADAEAVFRLGEYEYGYIYRDVELSLRASTASYGVYIAELARNLRGAMTRAMAFSPNDPRARDARVRYRHNIAHDGSISRLLSILQLAHMVWPGMGAEVVFELYSRRGEGQTGMCYFVRVLWGGQVLESSHPAFGKMDMIPVESLLAYFDGLVGIGASKVPSLCSS